ncbi:MAG TPA: FAD binding domain-containing protein, partial [Rariglobus sp.]
CNAVHASDLAVALLALDAHVHIRSLRGTRRLPFADFYQTPGETPQREHVLAADELITHVDLPAGGTTSASGLPTSERVSGYLKLRGRASYEFATASVAASLSREGHRIGDVAIALGGVGTVPWRIPAAESILRGQVPTPALLERFCDALLASACPTSQNAHKLDMARGAVRRLLEMLH